MEVGARTILSGSVYRKETTLPTEQWRVVVENKLFKVLLVGINRVRFGYQKIT